MLFMISSLIVCVFFFKQKTAYEMRISDWSSDVCSSDLNEFDRDRPPLGFRVRTQDLELCHGHDSTQPRASPGAEARAGLLGNGAGSARVRHQRPGWGRWSVSGRFKPPKGDFPNAAAPYRKVRRGLCTRQPNHSAATGS